MFTGIVQARLAVSEILKKEDFASFVFDFSKASELSELRKEYAIRTLLLRLMPILPACTDGHAKP
jgi:riboflavin synthase